MRVVGVSLGFCRDFMTLSALGSYQGFESAVGLLEGVLQGF